MRIGTLKNWKLLRKQENLLPDKGINVGGRYVVYIGKLDEKISYEKVLPKRD